MKIFKVFALLAADIVVGIVGLLIYLTYDLPDIAAAEDLKIAYTPDGSNGAATWPILFPCVWTATPHEIGHSSPDQSSPELSGREAPISNPVVKFTPSTAAP